MNEIFKALTSWKSEPVLQKFLIKVYTVLLSSSNVKSEDIIVNVLTEYKDLNNIFEKTENLILLNHSLYDYAIDLKLKRTFLFDLLYNLSAMKLNMFRKYLK